MAHVEQINYCKRMKLKHPIYFRNRKVLDIGSLDINGNNRYLFENCIYMGLDLAPGKNVDIVAVAHEFNDPDASYDTIISTELLEHDMHYPKTLANIVRLLKPCGMFLFTCAAPGRAEHGTRRTAPFTSPFTSKIPEWADYYKNLAEQDIRDVLDVDAIFSHYTFSTEGTDLQFIGFKKQ